MANEDIEFVVCYKCHGIVDKEVAENHKCFKDNQPSGNLNWDQSKTLALLTVYETYMEENNKQNFKVRKNVMHKTIAKELQAIDVTAEQVISKLNALLTKYKKCKDENSKSGRGRSSFEYFDRLDGIMGHRDANFDVEVTSSNISNEPPKKIIKLDEQKPSTSQGQKPNIEKALMGFMSRQESARGQDRVKREEYYKKQIDLKEQTQINKEVRHKELLEIEKMKCQLL